MATAIITALLAVLVFVFTQSFLKPALEPIQEQKKLMGEVAHALLFYANVFYVGRGELKNEHRREELEEARKVLQGLAGRLRTSLWTVPFYDTLARLGLVPKKEDVLEASTQLVGWSNSLYDRGGDENLNKRLTIIADRLGITKRLEAS